MSGALAGVPASPSLEEALAQRVLRQARSGQLDENRSLPGQDKRETHADLEFFAGRIANARTPAAYGRAVGQFLAWCEARGLGLEWSPGSTWPPTSGLTPGRSPR